MTWHKLTPALADELVRRRLAGESSQALAEEFGVTTSLVSHHVRNRAGVSLASPGLDAEQVDELVRRWQAGESVTSLAEEFQISASSACGYVFRRTGKKTAKLRRRSVLHLPDSQVSLSYLAAMIDAEGCITRNTKVQTCTWQVVITNTSEELRQWLRPLGGNFYYPRRQVNALQTFEWKITNARDVHMILLAVRPFLVIKRSRAEEAISDIENRFPQIRA